ncbi:MAG TPA: hypothetical protein VKS24_13400 [Bradyrhizobium sp.]|nr:hypothetical protein [Bradyrhizobium sp.]
MLVHIALTKGEDRELCARVGECVHRAVISALNPGEEGCLRVVTGQALDSRAAAVPARAAQADVAAVILVYPRSQISDRKKRMLFGRIGEGLEKECRIGKGGLVVGIIEQPQRNWYYGGAAMKLEEMMAGGLP